MARENFLVKATRAADGTPVYFNVASVSLMMPVAEKKAVDKTGGHPAGTFIAFLNGTDVLVSEPIKEIEQRAKKYGVLLIVE